MTDETPKQKKYYRKTHFPDRYFLVKPEIKELRQSICDGCGHYDEKTKVCKINGAFVPGVIISKANYCPLGQWGANYES